MRECAAGQAQGSLPQSDHSRIIARNSESNLSTDGSAFRSYFGATEA